MMVGIISGTYSSIFIASPVLTAWKEREPGFIRRRERIVAIDGSVPAFAEDGDLAMLGDDGETDVELEEEVAAAARGAAEGRRRGDRRAAGGGRWRRAVQQWRAARDRSGSRGAARARREAPRSPPAAPQTREEALMALLVWFTMGIALWHFTVFLPERFWQGIVGAFLGCDDRRHRLRRHRRDRQRQRPRRHRRHHRLDRDPRRRHRPRRSIWAIGVRQEQAVE